MDNLLWITEKASPPVGEDDAIYRQVINQAPDIQVAIYTGAEIDPELTAASGRNRYRNAPMICKRNVGEKDFISEPLTDEHKYRFPRSWGWWQAQKDRQAKTPVSLLPGITAAEIMELADLSITDVEALAGADVPEELDPLKAMALRLRTLSKPRMRLIDGQLRAA